MKTQSTESAVRPASSQALPGGRAAAFGASRGDCGGVGPEEGAAHALLSGRRDEGGGARDRHVQLLFLVEGTLVGLTGGALGLLLSWLASFPADRVARSLAERQVHTRLTESLFVFPPWLAVGVPLFVGALTMLAAAYPARRAARVNPITALRHE
jgi:hypothetical protein